MTRRTRTIINSLRSYQTIKEGVRRADDWWVKNPKGHPEPTLLSQEHLEGEYLDTIANSSNSLLDEARELVSYAGRERRG